VHKYVCSLQVNKDFSLLSMFLQHMVRLAFCYLMEADGVYCLRTVYLLYRIVSIVTQVFALHACFPLDSVRANNESV
jgi:hypothetical protein